MLTNDEKFEDIIEIFYKTYKLSKTKLKELKPVTDPFLLYLKFQSIKEKHEDFTFNHFIIGCVFVFQWPAQGNNSYKTTKKSGNALSEI